MAAITLLLRKDAGVQSVYFRYRPNRNILILLSTPYSIDASNWDVSNQCWNLSEIKKGAKTAESKQRNDEILDFNRNLGIFRNDIEKFINDNMNVPGDELKKNIKNYVVENYFAHRIIRQKEKRISQTIPERMHDLINFYIDQRSIEDKTKGTKPLAANTAKGSV